MFLRIHLRERERESGGWEYDDVCRAVKVQPSSPAVNSPQRDLQKECHSATLSTRETFLLLEDPALRPTHITSSTKLRPTQILSFSLLLSEGPG